MTSEEKISLENTDFSSKAKRVTSPHSIEACRLIGITLIELYPLTFDEYILQHKEVRNLQKNLQEERYNHFDKIRKEKIEMAKEKRKELIENEKNNKSKSQNNKSTVSASAVKDEKEKLEKIKKRQNITLKIILD